MRRLSPRDRDAHVVLRAMLWDDTPAEHRAELALYDSRSSFAAFGAFAADLLIGFAEATIRDYVDGVPAERPAASLEGLFVLPEHRRDGVAAALLAAVSAWAREHGCSHIGSDAELGNAASHAWHARMGFAETDRVIRYAMPIGAYA